MGYSSDATPCQWRKVAVLVWAGDGCNISGWDGANAMAAQALEH